MKNEPQVSRYNSYRRYLKSKFGKSVLKIPINGGFSCPNRDGVKSFLGCIFCDNRSFSPAAESKESLLLQLTSAINRSNGKYSAFLPYFQPFSNTYGSVERLKAAYEPMLSVADVIGLAVGTRPDCFTDDTFCYLEDLAERTYLSIELGLQSSHDLTLERLNRGHTFLDFCHAVEKLNRIGIETVAHVMLGLPGETKQMMIETAKKLALLPVSGVKIHQLMIIRGTELENSYNKGLVAPLTLQEYTEILCDFLSVLRPDQHIHRLMADSRTEFGLVAPAWSEHKLQSLSEINSYMERENVRQGDCCCAVSSCEEKSELVDIKTTDCIKK